MAEIAESSRIVPVPSFEPGLLKTFGVMLV